MAVDELAVGDGWAGGRAAEQEAGEISDAAATIEAVVPLARVGWQMLGGDAVEGAVEPALHVAEESSGSIRRPCNTLTATPTASPLASPPTAHARRWSAARPCGWRPTRSSPRQTHCRASARSR